MKPMAIFQCHSGFVRGVTEYPEPYYYYTAWLSGYLTEDSEDRRSFFSERRRKTFSDVCHAKYPQEDTVVPFPDWSSSWKRHPSSSSTREIRYLYSVNGRDTCMINNSSHKRVYLVIGQFSNGQFTYNYYVDFGWTDVAGKPRFEVTCQYNIAERVSVNVSETTLKFKSFSGTEIIRWSSETGETISERTSNTYIHLNLETVPRDISQGLPHENHVIAQTERYVDALVEAIGKIATNSALVTWRNSSTSRVTSVVDLDERLDSSVFLLHEPDVLLGSADDILFGKGFEHYWREELKQTSYLDAVQNVPRMSENNVSNILDIVSFTYNLVVLHKVEIPRSLTDAWLTYRYVYNTTKSDIEDAIAFMDRNCHLGNWDSIKSYGTSYHDYQGVSITCKTVMRVSPKTLGYVGRIWRSLTTYGLSPSFYMVWDMIPYSFIVDWFIPIGRLASVLDADTAFSEQYDINDVIYSLQYDVRHHGRPVHCYTRWLSTPPPSLNGFYFLENSASDKVIGMRILDALSLIIG